MSEPFDLVITVCDEANEACPYFPSATQRRHWSFPDPSAVVGDDETKFAAFRSVRDRVRERSEREQLAVRAS